MENKTQMALHMGKRGYNSMYNWLGTTLYVVSDSLHYK